MKLIIDTHIAIWTLSDDKRLSELARSYIENPNNIIYVSAVSVWKVAIKHQAKPETIHFDAEMFLNYCIKSGFLILPIKETHAMETEHLPWVHKDPFDRMLISQAKIEGMILLTSDEKIASYGTNYILKV